MKSIKILKNLSKWPDKEKEEKESEEKERSEPREPPKEDMPRLPLKESPNPLSEDSPEEVVSRESHHSSMMTHDKSSRDSSKESSEMPSPTPSTPEEKPSPPWTSSMPSRDKAEPSTVSEADQSISIFVINLFFHSFPFQYHFSTTISSSFDLCLGLALILLINRLI